MIDRVYILWFGTPEVPAEMLGVFSSWGGANDHRKALVADYDSHYHGKEELFWRISMEVINEPASYERRDSV